MTQFLGLGHEAVVQPVSAGLALWYEARKPGGVVLDGSSNVSQYTDFSGNGRHATQAVAAQRPAFVANGFNGLPSVRGDGANDFLSTPLVNSSTWVGFSLFLLAKDTTAALRAIFEKGNPAGAVGIGLYANGFAAGNFQLQWKGATSAVRSARLNTSDVTFATPTMLVLVLDTTQPSIAELSILRVNAVDRAFTYDIGAGVETTGGFGNIAALLFGRLASLFWPGDLPLLLFYDRALTLAEVQQNEQYATLAYGPFA